MSGIIGSKLNIRGSGRVAKLGTDGQVLTSSGAGKPANYEAGATSYDDDAVRDDIATLALHQATNANAAKYNLVNTNVDQYEDSTGIASFTDCERDTAGEYVSTIIPGNGIDSDTIFCITCETDPFTDISDNALTVTETGSGLSRSSTQAKFGTYSAYSNGSALTGLQVKDLTGDYSVGTGDWTCDFWIYQSVTDSLRWMNIGNQGTLGAGSVGPVLYTGPMASNSQMNGGNPSGGSWVAWYPSLDSTFSNDTWLHVAFQRTSGTCYGWTGGEPMSASYTGISGVNMETSGVSNVADVSFFSRSGNASEIFTGYMDNMRYSKVSRYTGGVAFTPPTTTYTPNLASATGNYVSTATTANASVSSMGAVITYTNNEGTNTLNTDIILEVSANGGTNYTTCVLEAAGTFSTGILQAVANDLSVTAGTSIQYRLSFANQALGSKEAQINGASLMY